MNHAEKLLDGICIAIGLVACQGDRLMKRQSVECQLLCVYKCVYVCVPHNK